MPSRPSRAVSSVAGRIFRSAIGPLLLGGAMLVIVQTQNLRTRSQDDFSARAEIFSYALEAKLSARAATLATFSPLFSGGITPDWRVFSSLAASGIVQREPGQLFAWAPLVGAGDDFETTSGRQGRRALAIRKQLPPAHKRKAPAAQLPILFADPPNEFDALLGLDLADHPDAERALIRHRAGLGAEVAVWGPVAIRHAPRPIAAFVVARPVFSTGSTRVLRGYLITTLPLVDLPMDLLREPSARTEAPSSVAFEIDAAEPTRAATAPDPRDVAFDLLCWHGQLRLKPDALSLRILRGDPRVGAGASWISFAR